MGMKFVARVSLRKNIEAGPEYEMGDSETIAEFVRDVDDENPNEAVEKFRQWAIGEPNVIGNGCVDPAPFEIETTRFLYEIVRIA